MSSANSASTKSPMAPRYPGNRVRPISNLGNDRGGRDRGSMGRWLVGDRAARRNVAALWVRARPDDHLVAGLAAGSLKHHLDVFEWHIDAEAAAALTLRRSARWRSAVDGLIREYYLVGPRKSDDQSAWKTQAGWPIVRNPPPLALIQRT